MKVSKWVILIAIGLVVGVLGVGVWKREVWLKTFKIGWIGPLTGSVDSLGIENERAIRMAIEEHNQEGWHQVEFRAEDDEYQVKKSVEAYKKLRDWGAEVIFVNSYSAMFPIAKLAREDGVVVVNSIDNDKELERIDGDVFLVGKETEDLARILAEDIIKSGVTKVGIVYYIDDDFMPTVALSLRQKLSQYGVNVTTVSYTRGQAGFSELASELGEVGAVAFLGYEKVGEAMKLVRESLPQAQFYTVNLAMKETAGEAMEGVKLAHFTLEDGNPELAKKFASDYEKRWGTKLVHPWTAMQGYDAINMVLKACGKIGWGWRWKLFRIKKFPGVTGNLTMNKEGRSEGIKWGLYRYTKGKVERL